MNPGPARTLLTNELTHLCGAEKVLRDELPRMAAAASAPAVRLALERHARQRDINVHRLERIFEQLDLAPDARLSRAMRAWVAQERVPTCLERVRRDAELLRSAQRVQRVQIAAYEWARMFAELAGHADVADVLSRTLVEEQATRDRLTLLAQSIAPRKLATPAPRRPTPSPELRESAVTHEPI